MGYGTDRLQSESVHNADMDLGPRFRGFLKR
jgi:hypothetical protein